MNPEFSLSSRRSLLMSNTLYDNNDITTLRLKAAKACDWCRKEYRCDQPRYFLNALFLAFNLHNDLLCLLGNNGTEGLMYLVENHPYQRFFCPFVDHLIWLSERNILDTAQSYNIAVYRGLLSEPALETILNEYIDMKPVPKKLYDGLMENNIVNPSLQLRYDTSRESIQRFVNAYIHMRSRLARSTIATDLGTAYIYSPSLTDKPYIEVESHFKTIAIRFPKKCGKFAIALNTSSNGVKKAKRTLILHSNSRYPEMMYLFRLLNAAFSLLIEMKIHNFAKPCECLNELTKFNALYSLQGISRVYRKPDGLLGLCVMKIQMDFQWKPYDLRKILPERMVDIYFTSIKDVISD